ncbi:MAG: AAA family ATPase [Bacillota bacterium]
MIKKIHILGASGSGTTTLGRKLSQVLDYKHFDTDDFFWRDTDPPFSQKRKRNERIKLLDEKLYNNEEWILSGSLCGWGDKYIPLFDLVIYLWVPSEIRMRRLRERQRSEFGDDIKPGGRMYETHLRFMRWAASYDSAGLSSRSRNRHSFWLSSLECEVLRIEEEMSLDEQVNKVLSFKNEKEG